jgi:RNA polymerase sigma-70 factor (ECF subfamily)
VAIEARFAVEVPVGLSALDAFGWAYAGELIHRAHSRLTEEAAQTRRERLFSSLEPYLAKEPSHPTLEMLAFAHGMRPLLISLALERLRQRFRELIDAEIAETVVDADELAVERRTLLMILSRRH